MSDVAYINAPLFNETQAKWIARKVEWNTKVDQYLRVANQNSRIYCDKDFKQLKAIILYIQEALNEFVRRGEYPEGLLDCYRDTAIKFCLCVVELNQKEPEPKQKEPESQQEASNCTDACCRDDNESA